MSLSREALDSLVHHDYPGNVRELENIVESMMVLNKGDVVTLNELPHAVRESMGLARFRQEGEQRPLKKTIDRLELEQIARAVKLYGSQREAARHLGVNQSTISRKLRKRGEE
jgi:DNA-binding NtrC family response regulator